MLNQGLTEEELAMLLAPEERSEQSRSFFQTVIAKIGLKPGGKAAPQSPAIVKAASPPTSNDGE